MPIKFENSQPYGPDDHRSGDQRKKDHIHKMGRKQFEFFNRNNKPEEPADDGTKESEVDPILPNKAETEATRAEEEARLLQEIKDMKRE